MNAETKVLDKAVSSMKWAFLVEIINRSIPPITTIILAQILAPSVFGEIASINIVINFLQIFVDFGLGKALVQTKEDLRESANQVFWISLLMGVIIYGIIYLISPLISNFFDNEVAIAPIRVLGLQVLFFALASCQQMLLVRDLKFKRIFWLKLVSSSFPPLFSIPIAFMGGGIWALVIGNVVGAFVNLVILWIQNPWKPTFNFNIKFSRVLLVFGFWALAEGVGNWFYWWGDNLFVRMYFGETSLGVYQIAWSLVSAIFALSVSSFVSILYPMFSQLAGKPDILISTYRKVNSWIIFIALPIGFGLAIVAPYIKQMFFSDEWFFITYAIQNFGLLFAISWIVGINYELYRAIGRPDINTKILFGSLLYYLPIYFITSKFGINTFILGRLIAVVLSIFVHWVIVVRTIEIDKFYLIQDSKYQYISCVVMVLLTSLFANWIEQFNWLPIVSLLVIGVFGFIIYFGANYALSKEIIMDVVKLVRYRNRKSNEIL